MFGIASRPTAARRRGFPFGGLVAGGSMAIATALLWAGPALAAPAQPELLGRSVVFNYPLTDPYDLHNLYGFNHGPSVTRLPNGELLAAWFSGPYEASVHQVILGAASSDGGQTWGTARVLHDTPRASDFDPAFIVDSERTWMFYSVGRWTRYPFVGLRAAENEAVGAGSFKVYAMHSDDAGRHWSEPTRVMPRTGWGCRSNGIRLSTGALLLPIHRFTKYQPGVLKSDDGGATWRVIDAIALPEGVDGAEPAIAEATDGAVRMIIRSRDGKLWSAVSDDGGETWGAFADTGLPAAAASHSLFRMSDGTLVLTHNPSPPPRRTPLTLRLSDDGGETWGEPLVLADVEHPAEGEAAWSRQVSYPSVTQVDGRTLLVVWTRIEMSAADQSGVIHAARVRVR